MAASCKWAVAAILMLSFACEGRAQVHVTTQQWHERAKKYGAPKRSAAGLGKMALGEIVTVGEAPNGFGKTVVWDRKAKEVTFVIFINTADPLGVAIANLKNGDEVQISSVSGIGSFSRGRGKLVSSIVGAAAMVGTALAPEAAPFIAAGEKFAREQFGQPSNSERRDGFGKDPGNGDWCQDEGGVVVCLPSAGGVYYQSGGGTKRKQPRWDSNRPNHVQNGFFPVPGDLPNAQQHNTRRIDRDGELYIIAWDSEFDDNLGYYKVFLKVKRP